MREDPCRRFAFGITMEGARLRLWLSNRALLAATEPIDFFHVRQRISASHRVLTAVIHLER